MCMAIYFALFALFLFYSDYVIDQYALSIASENQEWMVVALGWEMVPMLWPIGVLLMILASGITLFVSRRIGNKAKN